MFERFTGYGRQIVRAAQEEARSLGHGYVGTEHLLLALLRSDDRVVSRVVKSLGLTEARIHAEVLRLVGAGDEDVSGEMPFTPRAKAALELAVREAGAQGKVEPRHLLVGIAAEGEGVAARILRDADVDRDVLRTSVEQSGVDPHPCPPSATP
jgi:ATP-dependent Clp protease ATP-binding subunit ClpC